MEVQGAVGQASAIAISRPVQDGWFDAQLALIN
jgi:hypothetical protein